MKTAKKRSKNGINAPLKRRIHLSKQAPQKRFFKRFLPILTQKRMIGMTLARWTPIFARQLMLAL
jgi:hypothetical protein